MGSIGIDPTQARVYYHPGELSGEAKVFVVSPDNTPFRRSMSGHVKERSKSFNEDRSPVAGVLFFYAIETGRYDDRIRALDTIPFSAWPDVSENLKNIQQSRGLTFGDIFGEIQRAAADQESFQKVFQWKLTKEIADEETPPTDLVLWEKVAKKAATALEERIAKHSGESPADFDALFLQAVRETTLVHKGLPAQKHVEKRWIALANLGSDTSQIILRNPGNWKKNKKKLGFDWLPPSSDWKRDWLPICQD